jgi:uncharacterized membrane protein (DUF485 family)
MEKMNVGKKKIAVTLSSVTGIIAIFIVLLILSGYLTRIVGPFNSSIIVAIIVAVIIIVDSWILHSRYTHSL